MCALGALNLFGDSCKAFKQDSRFIFISRLANTVKWNPGIPRFNSWLYSADGNVDVLIAQERRRQETGAQSDESVFYAFFFATHFTTSNI